MRPGRAARDPRHPGGRAREAPRVMPDPADAERHARLAQALGRPELAWLVERLRTRLARGSPLTGSMTLRSPTRAQRAAMDRLLGRPPSRGASLRVRLAALEAILRRADLCPSLGQGVELLTGPVEDLQAKRRLLDSSWGEVFRSARVALDASCLELEPWLAELEGSGLLRRLCRDDATWGGRWLRPAIEAPGLLLDVGCGPGGLLAAAAGRDAPAAGIDTSLEWLVVARVLLREHGALARVAAGQAEALPLEDGAVGAAVSLDVIEHVQRPAGMLAEIDRVVASAGVLCFSTPNRFSLAAEPHVGVWGVGFLPRPLQPAYVQWRRGDPYDGTTLLSGTEIRRLLAETDFDLGLETPPVPAENLEAFSPRRAALGRAYNRLIAWPALRPVWLRVAPFFRATCRKNGAAPARTRVP